MYLLEDTQIVRPSGWREHPRRWDGRGVPAAQPYRSIGPADEAFPAHLRPLDDAPAPLWMRGTVRPEDALAVAIVGSRRATAHGLALAERLAGDLAARGVTVVSGLARGIDSAAHRGALDAGGRTIAVLGCGVDVVYPPENRRLAARVAAQGAVLSQFAPGMPALAHHFPIRNRLLAALALGVVVVEAAEASGSLITAGHAGDLGREVMAMPGPAGAPSSRGAHRLIRDGAALVESWEDVVAAPAGALAGLRGESGAAPCRRLPRRGGAPRGGCPARAPGRRAGLDRGADRAFGPSPRARGGVSAHAGARRPGAAVARDALRSGPPGLKGFIWPSCARSSWWSRPPRSRRYRSIWTRDSS